MNPKDYKRLFIYVDESGQDTKGRHFITSVLILEDEDNLEDYRETVLKDLEQIETTSKKQNIKWSKSYYKYSQKYIEDIANLKYLTKSIYIHTVVNSTEYIEATADAIAQAIHKRVKKEKYKATIYVDGFNKKWMERLHKKLKGLQIRTKKIRGVKKEQNNAFIRLVDAVCGLVRQGEKGNNWAKDMLVCLEKKKIITKIKGECKLSAPLL